MVIFNRKLLRKRINEEKLIELVREYTFLYDLSDRRYADNHRKRETWKEIAKHLQVKDCDCKKSWALLRDAFRRAIKKQKATKNVQGSFSRKKWKYEDEMSFLLPYFKERYNVQANYEEKDSDTEEICSDAESQAESASSIIAHSISPSNRPNITEVLVTRPSTSKNTNPILGSPNYASVSEIRKKITPRSTSNETTKALMEFTLENEAKTNDIQHFFDSIATTVRSFSPRDRAIAKSKVFKVISEMELEILGRNSSIQNGYLESVSSRASYDTHLHEQSNVRNIKQDR